MKEEVTSFLLLSKEGDNKISQKITDFYSQEFKEETIQELFQGWEKNKWVSGLPVYEVDRTFRISPEGRKISYSVFNEKTLLWQEKNKIKFPKILDEFISDCNRSGISLKWKEEIIEQIFF